VTGLKCKNKKLSSFLGAVAIIAGMTGVAQGETLKVCYDQWAPMTIFPTGDETGRGVVIDMLDEIYSSQGYDIEYYEVPLARGIAMVADGDCDMLPEYVYVAEAEKDVVYAAEKTFAYTTAFVIRRDDPWRYNGVKSMEGKRVATGPGWDYSAASVDYQNYIDNPANEAFVEVISGYDDVIDRIFTMIRDGRVDLYADNELVLQYVLNRLNMKDDLQVVRPGLEEKLVERAIFSKKMSAERRDELIRIWNEGRIAMKGEKEQAFLQKYDVMFKE
jgi:polar amino acid transport system substrate-binding protein